jgi:hypothetical protein
VFNNQVDAYKSWILFLIFASMVILISGVVLLTHKKPERSISAPDAAGLSGLSSRKAARSSNNVNRTIDDDEDDEEQALRNVKEGEEEREDRTVLWQVGDDSEDEDDRIGREHTPSGAYTTGTTSRVMEEGSKLIQGEGEADFEQSHEHSSSISSDATLAQPFHDDDDDDDFGQWK